MTVFCPIVDYCVFVIFDTSGRFRKCAKVPMAELAKYVASDVGRGDKWNYKVSISLGISIGIGRTDEALKAPDSLLAEPWKKEKL